MKQLFLLLLMLPFAQALVIDDAKVISPSLLQDIEQFNAKSPVQLSVITAPSTYDIQQQAMDNFKTHELTLLLFYVKNPSAAVVLQPEQEGIPPALVTELLDKYKANLPAALPDLSKELMQATHAWQKSYAKKPVCVVIKDGYCDGSCPETDLDCYCGDGQCQAFESSVTCSQDCGTEKTAALCGFVKDDACEQSCPFPDPDCPVSVAQHPEKQSIPPQYLLILLGVLAVLGALFFRAKVRT